MKINVGSIKETLGAKMDIESSIELETTEIQGQEIKFVKPCELELMVINTDEEYVLSGPGKVTVKVACNRCLEEFETQLEFDFNAQIPKEEVENDEIDLEDDLWESIRLALPMQLICDEDCQGLCPSCGTNLNNDDCDCYMHEVDPRLAKLEKLLDD